MKNKLEQKMDAEFERMDILPPKIYYFRRKMEPLSAVTIAVHGLSWVNTENEILTTNFDYFTNGAKKLDPPATRLLKGLRARHIYGVAICDKRNQFNRQRERIIAKGRLLKHLKEIKK